ncbi:MAG: alkaline phosphatase D family protein [Pirellulales bacterium]|nr:alkaline phosphatase D family protein [Pirellulales bacterium]
MSRRLWLAYGTSLAMLPALSKTVSAVEKSPTFPSNPFTLGVASGDPDHRSVVLWTRLAPQPLEPQGGMDPLPIAVRWELADDEGFQKIVASGTEVATPQLGHSVHVVPTGLRPDRWYYYRFLAGEATSPVGRTRTMPSPDSLPGQLRFAFASCQHYETGFYTAYGQMARDQLDLVFHLGDYIYEGAGKDGKVRKHLGEEIKTLTDYRIRHSQYRSDPLLQGMHAVCPWYVTWDDHELDNNYAGAISEKMQEDPALFLQRRANAYQAYYEAMPLRPRSLPQGPNLQLYRRGAFGRLAEFQVLDTRQYRTDQPNGDRGAELNDAALNPHNSILGSRQREWLQGGLLRSQGIWNILAQQVMMGMVGRGPEGKFHSMDQWPGYAHERMELVRYLQDRRIPNPVVLTGDIHSNWVNELRVDDHQPELPVVATEFVGTSISSGGNGVQKNKAHAEILAHNPGVKFQNAERGYVRCVVTPDKWQSDYVVVEDVLQPNGNVLTRESFVIESGRPGVNKA